MLAPWKKSYDKRRQHISIFKSRHHFANKVQSSQSYGFSSSHVWMWELYHKEGWVPKKWCFWTVVLEKTLKGPLVARRLNQSILKELNSEYSLDGLMLKPKLQYFGNLMWSTDSLENTLMLGKTEGRRRRGWQTMRWVDDSMAINRSKLQEIGQDKKAWGTAVHGVSKSRTWLNTTI